LKLDGIIDFESSYSQISWTFN